MNQNAKQRNCNCNCRLTDACKHLLFVFFSGNELL
ncbi:MAG: SWIM zinc finger family protein [Hoylesella marshii]